MTLTRRTHLPHGAGVCGLRSSSPSGHLGQTRADTASLFVWTPLSTDAHTESLARWWAPWRPEGKSTDRSIWRASISYGSQVTLNSGIRTSGHRWRSECVTAADVRRLPSLIGDLACCPNLTATFREYVRDVTRDRWSKWAMHEAAWHRPDPDRQYATMCGKHIPCELEIVSSEIVAAEIAANRTSVCGRCERLVERARSSAVPTTSVKGGQESPLQQPAFNSRELSPEQRALKQWLDLERVRRKEARRLAEAERKDEADKSRSVRTVSGGLPTLGKRHGR
jgi:hypothetical protein